jgi:hypothetical protein
VGYWSFDEGTSTKATDFSGNGRTGTLNANGNNGSILPVWTNGKRGAALDFDGDEDYESVPSSSGLNPTSTITVSAWIKADSWTGTPRIVAKGSSTANHQYSLGDSTDANTLAWNVGSNYSLSVIGTAFPSTGVWHHVVGVYSASLSAIYVDGALANSEDPVDPPIGSTADPLYIGGADAGSGICNSATECFDGKIDDVRIYNRALTAAEVRALYANNTAGATRANASSVTLQNGTTLGPADGLIGHWTFDGADVTQARIYDRSGQNNNGYLSGVATSSATAIGKLGQALKFDGVNDSVRMPNTSGVADNLTNITASAWIKMTANQTGEIVGKNPNASSG